MKRIKDYDTFVSESMWRDTIIRNAEGRDRMENNINLFSRKELFDYFNKHYICKYPQGDNGNTFIDLYFCFFAPIWLSQDNRTTASIHFIYEGPDGELKKVELSTKLKEFSELEPKVISVLKDKYNVSISDDNKKLTILPKTGKINNEFCVEVLDTFLDNLEHNDIITKK